MTVIEKIRKKLQDENLDAYVIAYGNRYIGQDISSNEHKLSKLCGFTGSAGIAVVTKDSAYLLVDGRYELQAKQETEASEIVVVDLLPRLKNVCDLLKPLNVTNIGYDAWCHTVAEMEFIKRHFFDMKFFDAGDWLGANTKETIKIRQRDVAFSGQSSAEKIAVIKNMLKDQQAEYYLFTSADSVSWLMNIYAHDLPYSPVVRAYALVAKDGNTILYGDNLVTELSNGNWQDFTEKMANLGEVKLMYDAHIAPEKIKTMIDDKTKLIKAPDICQMLKAEKNPVEMQGMINCHIRDGVALSKFLCWLDENYRQKTELDVVKKLHSFRAEQKYFWGESFNTIAGFAQNGAVVHYQPNEKTNKVLDEGSLLLLDSGGQYLDGTTDVTRTIALGKPSKEMIRDFTLVLKAHVALASACFPIGTAGVKLDILARNKLWQRGLDYKHGTGHGVACFGNVHEGPISISTNSSDYGFKSNMITSDEPGIYKENEYGIRTENLLYTVESENSGFLKFNILTKVPIDKRLIDKYMLENGEQMWLNNYHQDVYESLAPYMNEKEKMWLKDVCSPL
ncbi:MAG: aminopeptidase P family protein [Alphaproteobacteria bacterium]|nr:aminopeptidase P family protein [Alphaproteobacteria bacterium]